MEFNEETFRLRSRVETPWPGNGFISGRLLIPAGRTRYTVIVVHTLRSTKERYLDFASFLAARGTAAALFDLPIHGERAQGNGTRWKPPPFEKPADLSLLFRQIVSDARFVADYLRAHPRLRKTPIGTFGVSFGGLVASMMMGFEERIRKGLSIAGVGDPAEVLLRLRFPLLPATVYRSPVNRLRLPLPRLPGAVIEMARELKAMTRRGFTDGDVRRALEEYAPSSWAPRIRPPRQLTIVAGSRDRIFPIGGVREIARMSGAVRLEIHGGGHHALRGDAIRERLLRAFPSGGDQEEERGEEKEERQKGAP